jgi:integrase/recombinase XerD
VAHSTPYAATVQGFLIGLVPSWQIALKAENKSPKTMRSYLDSVRALQRYLGDREATPEHIRGFLVAEIERTSAVSAQVHFRNLRVFFGWLVAEGELDVNPMTRVAKPQAAEEAKPFFTDADLARLLKATSGQDFEARRDHAILRILIDTGVRVSGVANLRFDPEADDKTDVFLHQNRLRVTLKGGQIWWIPIGRKTAAAIDRYLRARARNPHRASPWLWIGTRGHDVTHFGDSGIRAMLRRRGMEAGVQNVHPHRFRHTAADALLAAGASVDDVMYIMGWKSYTMPMRYARGRGIARAAEAHARISPGDRL